MAEASDFKIGTQLGLAKAHNKIPKRAWPWAKELPNIFGVTFSYFWNG